MSPSANKPTETTEMMTAALDDAEVLLVERGADPDLACDARVLVERGHGPRLVVKKLLAAGADMNTVRPLVDALAAARWRVLTRHHRRSAFGYLIGGLLGALVTVLAWFFAVNGHIHDTKAYLLITIPVISVVCLLGSVKELIVSCTIIGRPRA